MKRTNKQEEATRFMTLCNLLETMWAMKKPWEVDTEELIPFTSPQARRIAGFIEELFEVA